MNDEKKTREQLLEELNSLRNSLVELETIEAEHRNLEQELENRTRELEERVKELNCLYSISRLFEEKGMSSNGVLQRIIDIVPLSLRSPENNCARITLKDQTIETRNFVESPRKLASDIIVHGNRIGSLEIFCLKEEPGRCGKHFLKEEEHLVRAVTELMGRIIEQKQTEKALLESEERFRCLVENSPTAIFIIQDGQIVYENPEEKKLSGPVVQLFRHGNLENIHPDDFEKVREGFQKIVSGEIEFLDMDFRFYPRDKKDGDPGMKWVNCRASLVEYFGRQAILVNKLDVTRTKELERLLRIEDKMSSLGRVASGIAHEIRSPLSGINIYLNNLEKIFEQAESREKVKEIIRQLQSASSKIESVIRRVIDFSKPSEPKFILTDINQPIGEAMNLSSVTLRKSGIALIKTLAEDLPPCHIDPHLIGQVILNLMTNAAEAMKKTEGAKRIEITSSMQESCIVLSVSDSGPGVPFHLRRKVFDPFYTTKDDSTGIGLTLCERIITDHGGTLTVLTSKWGGAEFKAEIPIERKRKKA
jgi:PAS domain S-box-containing protein